MPQGVARLHQRGGLDEVRGVVIGAFEGEGAEHVQAIRHGVAHGRTYPGALTSEVAARRLNSCTIARPWRSWSVMTPDARQETSTTTGT